MKVPKIVFSEARGVFLGFEFTPTLKRELWSFTDAKVVGAQNLAPTFRDLDELRLYLHAAMGQPIHVGSWHNDLELRDCPTANGPGNAATSTNCKDSSIPGWD